MRTLPYSGKTIRGRWFRPVVGALLGWLSSLLLRAEPVPALARFSAGVKAAEQQRYQEAAQHLRAARAGVPQLADYVGYWLAVAEFDAGNHSIALRELEAVWKAPIASPLAGKAALLAARIHLAAGTPQEGVRLLRSRLAELPQPEAQMLLAACLEAAGNLPAAAAAYQHVYYRHPAAPEAATAEKELARLRARLGENYPPPMPQEMLARAEAWLRARQYRRARLEYEALSSQLGGKERELARVRVGAAMYFDYDTKPAYDYLRSIEAADPEADAERLYYLAECARRLGRDDEMLGLVERLGALYPRSLWRLKALVNAGNRYLLENQPDKYVPLYRACYESFPNADEASYCHWKVTWHFYLSRRAEAANFLREHLSRYPGSEKAAAALYFLGRLAERQGAPGAARTWYEALRERFPNYYYAHAAGERLRRAEPAQASPSAEVAAFLDKIAWPDRSTADGFDPSPPVRLRLQRARLLGAAGLDALREEELRFGAGADGQPHVVALELARVMSATAPVHRVLRTLKDLVPGNLTFRREQAPKQFWTFLFPFPHRSLIATHARRQRLDPFLIAGLIRQESEFNPGAVSPARAYGLAQILPSQGRILARQLGLRRYRTSMLFQPSVNLRLGTYFLRSLLDKFQGRMEVALAAYNAGPNRAERWLTWSEFEEPAEFIETIPFTETRNYVTAVLRNAEMYRRLYAPVKAPTASAKPRPAPGKPEKKASAAKPSKTAPAAKPAAGAKPHSK